MVETVVGFSDPKSIFREGRQKTLRGLLSLVGVTLPVLSVNYLHTIA